jgi:hypothetical protein
VVSLLLLPALLSAQSVSVKLDGDQLRVASPQLRFLGTEVLQRLHNGIAVNYVFTIGIAPERYSKPLIEVTYRFVVSYDIFEEKFAVSRINPNPHSITHLSEAAAQLWCLDSIMLSPAKLRSDQSFWVILDYKAEEPKSTATDSSNANDSLMGQLIDVFSRKAPRQESHGVVAGGPFRIADLRRTH